MTTEDRRLPADNERVTRWTAARKERLVQGYESGQIALAEVLGHYGLTLEEFASWRQAFRLSGRKGLQALNVPRQRQAGMFG